MRRFLLVLMSLWKQQLKFYVLAALAGALIGLILLAPSYEYISFQLDEPTANISSLDYFAKHLQGLFNLKFYYRHAPLLLFYAEIGALVGVISLFLHKLAYHQLWLIDHLKEELDKDLRLIILQGEGSTLEFKSTFRWDLAESRINRHLETVVLKTVAGFLNSQQGGNLLIGVADNGEVLGLAKDFQTLKKMDQDGFEQSVMTAISSHLGADICTFVHVLFYNLDGKQVCRLIIAPANRPVFLEQGNAPKFFVRTGAGTRDLNIQEAVSYIFHRWQKLNKQQLKPWY